MTRRLALVVVAAGSSVRMDGTDKVWAPLAGRPVLCHSISQLASAADVVVAVVHADRLEDSVRELSAWLPRIVVVGGGSERQESVARGMEAAGDVDIIAVHDAARPFARRSLIDAGVNLLEQAEGAIPVDRVRDTIKRVSSDGLIMDTLDRSSLWAAQTPQVFRAAALRLAHQRAREWKTSGTDDAALMECAGYTVATFPGEEENFKITTAHDLRVARLLLEHGSTR